MSDKSGEITNLIWIAALGKLLVRKGVLTPDEIISELQESRSAFENMTEKAMKQLIYAEIDNAVQAVRHW